ncbi:MAG: PEGA domain-containing protein [Polyangiales bacterium]|nr:PEGA domain-containing protein [Myxococcales bacterium]
MLQRETRKVGVLWALLAFACGTTAVDARAQDGEGQESTAPTPSARELFRQGQVAYESGDYEEAARLWEQAYTVEAVPALQYNLAQAYGRLGRLSEELAALQLFVARAEPGNPQLDSARARLGTLQERLARTGIQLEGQHPGATVLVDGEVRGQMPIDTILHVGPGSHVLLVQADGYQDFRATVAVPEGETISVAVLLEEHDSGGRSLTAPIALYAAGGGLVVVGAVLGGVALSTAKGARAGSSDATRARGLALGADLAIGAGVATAGVGLVIHLLRRRSSSDEEDATEVAPIAGRGNFGLQLTHTF